MDVRESLYAAIAGAHADVGVVEVDGAVRAGVAAVAAGQGWAEQMAERLGRALASVAGLYRRVGPGLLDGSSFGLVVPVLAGSPGAGASVVSAALADVLQLLGRRVLLVDAADPARSGLAEAATNDGPWVREVGPVAVRWSWRQQALLARLEASVPVTPALVPPPAQFMPELTAHAAGIDATVVDLGCDGWRVLEDPVCGAGAWLRVRPGVGPVVVVRASRPSLRHAEQVLARLAVGASRTLALPLAVVVVGAQKWPRDVVGAAGPRLQPLLDEAVFVPHDAVTATAGITGELLAERVVEAVLPLAALIGFAAGGKGDRRSLRQSRRAATRGTE